MLFDHRGKIYQYVKIWMNFMEVKVIKTSQ